MDKTRRDNTMDKRRRTDNTINKRKRTRKYKGQKKKEQTKCIVCPSSFVHCIV
jgi:hypothetical protein